MSDSIFSSHRIVNDLVYKTLIESTLAIPWSIDWGTKKFSYIDAQTLVHRDGDVIQPSHPLSSPSPAFHLYQCQGLV